MTVYKTLRALFCAIEWHKKVPIKGLEKGDGVPSSPCGLRRDKLGREKGPIQQKVFSPSSSTDPYWEQNKC